MFNENSIILIDKVIGLVIYASIDEYICLGFLGLLKEKLSKYDNNF